MPRKPVGNHFVERARARLIDEHAATIGEVHELATSGLIAASPQVFYEHPQGEVFVGDSIEWLAGLEAGSVDLIFADPPYNVGKADWDRFESSDEYLSWSLSWIEHAARVLKDEGAIYITGYSEVLADLRRPAAAHFSGCRWLIWSYRNKANLHAGWGRSHESILFFTKGKKPVFNVDPVRVPYGRHTLRYPEREQATSSAFASKPDPEADAPEKSAWRPHPDGAKPRDVFEIPITSNGMAEKTPHPTQKPEELLRRLLLASTNPGDLVVDPFFGSGTTLVAAAQLGRRFAGCDLEPEYATYAVARLESIPRRSPEEWIAFDRDTALRRTAIR